MGVVHTTQGKCRKCYSCIRNCPVKAIRVENEQSQVVDDLCISCGQCVKVCRQDAKQIEDGTGPAKELLQSGRKVAVCVAPSFVAEYPGLRPGQFFSGLKALGFSYTAEVSFGASLILDSYRGLLRESDDFVISTACPAIVNLVEIHHPDLVPHLAPIVSPMAALGRYIRRFVDPDMAVVFVGPCLAKKSEAKCDEISRYIDAVLTFDELDMVLLDRGITLESLPASSPDLPDLSDATSFPISGGLSYSLGLQGGLLNQEYVVCEGPTECLNMLNDIEKRRILPRFVDLLFCRGCIDGPGMTSESGLHFRKHLVSRYVKEKRLTHSPHEFAVQAAHVRRSASELDLTRSFKDRSLRVADVSEQEIQSALARIGKQGGNQLNCGACGYDNCRDMAVAICRDAAEVEMCLPHLIDELAAANKTITRSSDDLRILLKVGRAVNSTLELDRIMDAVEDGIKELFDADDSGVFLYDVRSDTVLHSSCSLDMDRFGLSVAKNVVADRLRLLLRRRGAMRLCDIASSRRNNASLANLWTPDSTGQDILIAPIVISDDLMGFIEIERNAGREQFITRDLRMLELLSDSLANAVNNALSYESMKKLTERLKALNDLTKTVSENLDLESALTAVAHNMEKVLDADVYHLSVIDGAKSYIYMSPENISLRASDKSLVPYESVDGYIPFAAALEKADGPIVMHSDDEMAARDRDFLTRHDLKSVLVTPIRSVGELIAVISFGYTTRIKQRILAEQIDRCAKAGEILGLLITNAKVLKETNKELTARTGELEEARAAARRSEKLAILGKMAAIVAHELRTPVSSLRMSLFTLRTKVVPELGDLPEIATLEESVTRLRDAMDNLLDFSRDLHIDPQPSNINEIVRYVCSMVPQALPDSPVTIEETYDDSIGEVRVDRGHLERALTNLLLNAMEAAPREGGIVAVTTHSTPHHVQVSVMDNGPGIPKETMERLFEPFFTTKDKGTGLGLSIVKKVAEAHGGRVSVESRPSRTVFTIELPVA